MHRAGFSPSATIIAPLLTALPILQLVLVFGVASDDATLGNSLVLPFAGAGLMQSVFLEGIAIQHSASAAIIDVCATIVWALVLVLMTFHRRRARTVASAAPRPGCSGALSIRPHQSTPGRLGWPPCSLD